MLSYRRETALQGALQFSPKVEDWNWETTFYGHYRSICNVSYVSITIQCRDMDSDLGGSAETRVVPHEMSATAA